MTNKASSPIRLFAVDPCPRGFAFAVLEMPADLVDWGLREVMSDKEGGTLQKVNELINHYAPDFIILEDWRHWSSRRCSRIKRLLQSLGDLAKTLGVECRTITQEDLRFFWERMGCRIKDEVAQEIARMFPVLAPRLPPRRRAWMPEDPRINIFDTIALAVAFFHMTVADIS